MSVLSPTPNTHIECVVDWLHGRCRCRCSFGLSMCMAMGYAIAHTYTHTNITDIQQMSTDCGSHCSLMVLAVEFVVVVVVYYGQQQRHQNRRILYSCTYIGIHLRTHPSKHKRANVLLRLRAGENIFMARHEARRANEPTKRYELTMTLGTDQQE